MYLFKSFNLQQHVTYPTHVRGNIIDIIIDHISSKIISNHSTGHFSLTIMLSYLFSDTLNHSDHLLPALSPNSQTFHYKILSLIFHLFLSERCLRVQSYHSISSQLLMAHTSTPLSKTFTSQSRACYRHIPTSHTALNYRSLQNNNLKYICAKNEHIKKNYIT